MVPTGPEIPRSRAAPEKGNVPSVHGFSSTGFSPLDPLAFTEKEKLHEKVKLIQRFVGPGSSCRNIRKGQIIFLSGDPDEMEARVVGRNKESKSPVIKEMQEKLLRIYGNQVACIDTTGATVYDVVKRVASAILKETYKELDLSGCLNAIV